MKCTLPFVHTHAYTGLTYVRSSDLPAAEQGKFEHWMVGQTRPWIDGLEPMDACYPWDYEAYLRAKAGLPVAWD